MSDSTQVTIPDIGDFDEVEIIEILVAEGDKVSKEDPLLTLESDKATMEIPSPGDGIISDIKVSVGEKVSEGSVVMMLGGGGDESSGKDETASDDAGETGSSSGKADDEQSDDGAKQADPGNTDDSSSKSGSGGSQGTPASGSQPPLPPPAQKSGAALPHASPAIRRFARELGADLTQVSGAGPKGRILKEDVQKWVKAQLEGVAQGTAKGSGIPEIPAVDFSKFGEVETISMSRIKKLSGPHLQRAWLNIPHVTNHDEADITELEEFRQSIKDEAAKEGVRITLLGFMMKILVGGLKKFPNFNASLHPNGENLILKKYYNIGIAVDTPNGLMVPVIKGVDRKSISELAAEMGELSAKARDGKLAPGDMQGGCISISSLGGIGGTGFTPIVNAPEVAILGLSRSKMAPVWDEETGQFEPRLMLPISLSYDHRVIDGAEAARFCAYLTRSLADVRRLAL